MKRLWMLASFVVYVTIASMVSAQGQSSNLTAEEYQSAHGRGITHSLEIQKMFSDRMNYLKRGIQCGDIVIAEGDSWFDYGYRQDIISELEEMGWVVYSSAHYGDTLEYMLYGDGQIESVYSYLVKIHKNSEISQNSSYFSEDIECLVEGPNYEGGYIRFPKAILLSFGGNDILGKALAFLLEHGDSSADGELNPQIKKGLFVRIERMLIEYISTVRSLCIGVFEHDGCKSIPIFLHGYDYVEATGKAFYKFGLGPGPWIKPTFDEKKQTDESGAIIELLVNDFNHLLCQIATQLSMDPTANPIYHISFLGMVQGRWKDEIHPDSKAVEDLAEKISGNIVNFHESRHMENCI